MGVELALQRRGVERADALRQGGRLERDGRAGCARPVREIRFEIASGSVRVLAGEDRQVAFQGGLRRAGNTAELLARIEQVPATLEVTSDPERSEVLVLRGPALPAGVSAAQ